MANYTFPSNNQSWSTAEFVWTSGDGSPSLGCMSGYAGGAEITSSLGSLSISTADNDPVQFRYRVTSNSGDFGYFNITLTGTGTGASFTVTEQSEIPIAFPFDSGWILVQGNVTGSGTITALSFSAGPQSDGVAGTIAFDAIYVAESPPATDTARRLLKMDSDGGNLFVSGISGGTLTMYQYSLAGLTVTSTSTFGTCSYTDPDTFTRGIFPVARPGGDGILYAYGRDANNVQVQYRDYNGTLGWVDVGAGTATWVTTKYCVALMPDVFRHDNLIAVFNDGSVYTTDNGTMLWDRQGSVTTTTLRTAARAQTTPEVIYVAGTAAGTIYQSCNNGNTFGAMGTSTMGTINALEVLD